MIRKKIMLLMAVVAVAISIPIVVFANGGKGEADLHQVKGAAFLHLQKLVGYLLAP